MKKSRSRIVLNILIALCSIGAWLVMVFHSEGMLTDTGLRSLKYFTVLSNLFEGTACIIWLFAKGEAVARAEKIKYAGTVSVALTFLTVMFFLGPLYGYISMLSGVNLFLHLLVPVAALAECIFLSRTIYSRKDNLLSVVPMLVYGTFYLGNNLINGTGEWPATNDWYSFLYWGYPIGIGIFAVLCLVTYGAGAVIRIVNNYYDRKASGLREGEVIE
ncbi:MAG: hypothetical protein IKE85_00790 [Mogibacterium sp.]|nr:hypothetical protein [Mogibacterium sp.]